MSLLPPDFPGPFSSFNFSNMILFASETIWINFRGFAAHGPWDPYIHAGKPSFRSEPAAVGTHGKIYIHDGALGDMRSLEVP